MESPVRIYSCAALVVSILLLSSTTVTSHTLPEAKTSDKEVKPPIVTRSNATWLTKRVRKSDIALNELKPKDASAEENSDKNAKYKDRGRVRYLSKSNKDDARRKSNSRNLAEASEKPNLIIVTPTPEVKNPAQIIDSMRTYKKTKMPVVKNATTTSSPETNTTKRTISSKIKITKKTTTAKPTPINVMYPDVDNNESTTADHPGSEKYNDGIFMIPNFDDEINHSQNLFDTSHENKYFSNYPDSFYGPDKYEKVYDSENYFNFDTELTTPKNEFFDKKFEEISQSIKHNLKTAKRKAPSYNDTKLYKIVKENTDLSRLSNGTPNNKSTVIFKNTKEVRLLDNEKAGTSNKELSDVHGTSIYYEMSVLSTETYNIDQLNDDDCDNDTQPEPTQSTSAEEEIASRKSPQLSQPILNTEPLFDSEALSTLSSNYLPVSSVGTVFFGSVPFSTHNPLSSTEGPTRLFSSNFTRDRNYSKRLRISSPNSVTSRPDLPVSNQNFRISTRKFYSTTPKTKSVWIAPRRNYTRTPAPRTTTSSTVYYEHFSIKDVKPTENIANDTTKNVLTTATSEIDPVLQGDVGVKKIVHQNTISDNSIPSLRKRGSSKYSTTATSNEEETQVQEMEIPPTLTAWALASLLSPPNGHTNSSTHKSVDENELQKVGEVTENKKETTTNSPSSTQESLSSIANDIMPNKAQEIDQNKLPWKPVSIPPMIEPEVDMTNASTTIKIPTESNTLFENLIGLDTNTPKTVISDVNNTESTYNDQWVPVTDAPYDMNNTAHEEIPPVDAKKSTGFESITKLPSDLTTPQNDDTPPREENEADDVRYTTTEVDAFVYMPTEVSRENTEVTTYSWHKTGSQQFSIKDEPITTYRPKYVTTTDIIEDTTTNEPEIANTSSQTTTQGGKEVYVPQITQTSDMLTTTQKNSVTSTTKANTEPTSTLSNPNLTTSEKEPIETSTMIEVVTQITEELHTGKPQTTTTEFTTTEIITTETPPSEIKKTITDNSVSNEVVNLEPFTTPAEVKLTPIIETTTIKTQVVTEKKLTTTETVRVQSTEKIEVTTRVNNSVKITTPNAVIVETSKISEVSTTDNAESTTKTVLDQEDNGYGDMTTEASLLLPEEAGSGVTIAITVSCIGILALILLIGLLLIARRRARRGVYAQRCTPVSLDAFSLDSVSVGQRKGNQRYRASKRSYGNPAFDDEVTSHPMQYPALANFALDIESVTAEFYEIPSVTVKPDDVPPGCEDKNRYSNVLPLPETRVALKRIGNDPNTEYINANYITGPGNIRNYYIACQAPMSNTVVDFWRMVWEQNSRLIVMLTEYMENGVEKCYEYLPPSEISDNKRTFGKFQIVLLRREQRDKYAISTLNLTNTSIRTSREITHLWYFWPAKGVPEDYDSVIEFLQEMRSYMKMSQTAKEYDSEGVEVIYGDESRSSVHNLSRLRSEDNNGSSRNVYSPARAEEQLKRDGKFTNGTLNRIKVPADSEGVRPCVVMCASGAGRSAALIAADICTRALSAAAADVPRVVRELRAQRPHSLSNKHHYIFLYKLLSEYGHKLLGGGGDTI